MFKFVKRAIINPNTLGEFIVLINFYLLLSVSMVGVVFFFSTWPARPNVSGAIEINSILNNNPPYIYPEENTNFDNYIPEPLPAIRKFWI